MFNIYKDVAKLKLKKKIIPLSAEDNSLKFFYHKKSKIFNRHNLNITLGIQKSQYNVFARILLTYTASLQVHFTIQL